MNPHLTKHIDSISINLVNSLSVYEIDTTYSEKTNTQQKGSLGERELFTIPNPDCPESYFKIGSRKKTTSSWYENQKFRIGLEGDKYIDLEKLVLSILKDKVIGNICDREFIEDITFKWIISAYTNKKVNQNLSNLIIDKIQGSKKLHTYSFPILYLEIESPIKIGEVEITFYSKKEVQTIIENDNYSDTDAKELRKLVQGKTIARASHTGTSSKAKEQCLVKCEFALDILKVCSDTVEFPDIELHFDLENRSRLHSGCIAIHQPKPDKLQEIGIELEHQSNPITIDSELIKRMKFRHFEQLSAWNNNFKETELNKLLKKAISLFAEALSETNLHRRISLIFSIYESLLVPNENEGILESVKKYGSKLLAKDIESRKKFKSNISDMYKVRSSLIHHGKERSFELNDLRLLQLSLLIIISDLMDKSQTFNTKLEILQDIDIEIEKAY